jgi:septum formation protein
MVNVLVYVRGRGIVINEPSVVAVNDKTHQVVAIGREAKRMLKTLNGRRHSVITGFTILNTGDHRRLSRSVETKVYFKRMMMKEIGAYVKTEEPLDKAGGYAIQGLGAMIVKRIEGDYYNVMGLPLNALMEGLKRFGVYIK